MGVVEQKIHKFYNFRSDLYTVFIFGRDKDNTLPGCRKKEWPEIRSSVFSRLRCQR